MEKPTFEEVPWARARGQSKDLTVTLAKTRRTNRVSEKGDERTEAQKNVTNEATGTIVHGIDGNARKGVRWIGDWAAASEPALLANVGSHPKLKHVRIIR